MLRCRHQRWLELPAETRDVIDRCRIVPTGELHDILLHYTTTGTFIDE